MHSGGCVPNCIACRPHESAMLRRTRERWERLRAAMADPYRKSYLAPAHIEEKGEEADRV